MAGADVVAAVVGTLGTVEVAKLAAENSAECRSGTACSEAGGLSQPSTVAASDDSQLVAGVAGAVGTGVAAAVVEGRSRTEPSMDQVQVQRQKQKRKQSKGFRWTKGCRMNH